MFEQKLRVLIRTGSTKQCH